MGGDATEGVVGYVMVWESVSLRSFVFVAHHEGRVNILPHHCYGTVSLGIA